jgi:hypothetical protein
MPLVLAIKNSNSIVFASDTDPKEDDEHFSQCMVLPNRSVLLVAGNLAAIKPSIDRVLSEVRHDTVTAVVAQLIQAALIIDVVPHLDKFKGRAEIIVAGLGHPRHDGTPELFYMDSATDFYLKVADSDVTAGGATAAIQVVLGTKDFQSAPMEHLKVLAKECVASTKMRWPLAVKGHIKLGVITPVGIHIQTI